MSGGVKSKQVIHVSSRAGYVNPYEISETPAYIYSIDPAEGAKTLRHKRTALFALDSYGNCAIDMAKALIAENVYDVHMHYLYPNPIRDLTNIIPKATYESLVERFYRILKQFASNPPGGLERTIDLFATVFSLKFILKSLERVSEKFFDRLFILPSRFNESSFEMLGVKTLSLDEQLKRHFTSLSYPFLEGGVFLEVRTIPEVSSRKGISNIIRFQDIYKAIALKSKELTPSSKRTSRETLIVSDCKNLVDQNQLSKVQHWNKEFPKKECFKLLAGKRVAILVHGMDNTADEAYDSYKKLASQIYGNYDYILYYIWPGAGKLAHQSYNHAKDEKLTSHYAELLTNLKKNRLTSIDVIAHSMGNRFTLQTLSLFKAQSEKVIDNFFMVAPAVPNDCFEQEKKLYYEPSHLIKNVFVLWTEYDKAMMIYPIYPAGSPSIKGLGDGVRSANKLPEHVMAIELSSIVPGHGLAEFENAFPLIHRLGAYKKRNTSAEMDELQSEVHAFFQERRISTRYTQWVDVGEGMVFEHPICQFKNNKSPTRCLYDSAGVL